MNTLNFITGSECKTLLEKGQAEFVDTRSCEQFSFSHIAGSVNIPFSENISYWAGMLLGDRPCVIIFEKGENISFILNAFREAHIDILGFLEEDLPLWEKEELSLSRLEIVTPEILAKKQNEKRLIIDVRTETEWRSGHISGAIHIPLNLFKTGQINIAKDTRIAIVCGSGYRSGIAASILKKEGFTDVANIEGGMQGKVKDCLPIVIPD